MRRALFVTTAVLALVSVARAANITLTWDAGVGGGTPQGFIVERKSGTAPYAEIARPVAPPYTDTTVPALALTCFVVRAYNEIGVSGPSNELCLDVPRAPINLTISTSGPTAVQARVSVKAQVRKR